MILERINGPADIKKLETNQLNVLAKEMRNALIKKTSACGGHLASNLGIVEITIGLHRVFDAPNDKIIYDVSHQTYCHKMLTGRKDAFLYPDKYEDVCGYSNPNERPAGKVFMNKESNEFYRPVQSNENCYGEKMRILKINPNMNDWMGVEDKQISIEDLHINLIRRTHTFNSVNDIIVVDGLIEHKTLMAPYFVIKRKLHNLKFKMRNDKKI